MVDEDGLKKKRKTVSEPDACPEQSIEALQRFNELHASWPKDVTSLLSEALPQVPAASLCQGMPAPTALRVHQVACMEPMARDSTLFYVVKSLRQEKHADDWLAE